MNKTIMRDRNLLKHFILVATTLLVFPGFGYSQSLFSEVSPANESSPQTLMKNDLSAKFYASDVRIINLNSISSAQNNGIIKVNFPNDSATYLYRINYFSDIDSTMVWNGELITNETAVAPNTLTPAVTVDSTIHGFLTLIEKNGRTFGAVSIDTNYYQIRNYGSNRTALVLTNKSYDPICTMEGTGSPIEPDPEEEELETRDVCNITAIVFVCEGISAYTPDINDLIRIEIERTNITIANSKARYGANRLVLKSINDLPSTVWTPYDDNDNKTINNVQFLKDERDNQHADLVFVISPNFHQQWQGAVNGYGDDNPTANSEAYAIIDVGFLNSERLVFTHEFGHLMGCRHHSGVDGDDPFCFNGADVSGLSHSHGWKVEKKRPWPQTDKTFVTVMTSCGSFVNGTFMNFSNPDVKWKKKKTGKNAKDSEGCSANNAKTIRDATCRISAYRTESLPAINITGKHFGCPNEEVRLTGYAENITGTITYIWQTSLDGFNYYDSQSGSMDGYVVTLPDIEYMTVFIRLNVQSTTGVNLVTYYEIQAIPDPIHCGEYREASKERPATKDRLNIYPSPAQSEVTISLESNGDIDGRIELYNAIGQQVSLSPRITKEFYQKSVTIDISQFQSGIYTCRYKDEMGQTISGTFIIIN